MIDKIGLQTFTIRKDIKTLDGLREEFSYFAALGIKNFELSRINFNKDEMEVLKNLKDELNLEYTASQITLRKIIDNFDFMANLSRELDIRYLEVSVIPFKSFIRGKKGIDELSKTLNKLGERTKQENIKLLYHHHNFELINYGEKLSMDILLESTESELVNLVCDTYWLAKSGYNPANFIEERIDRVKGVHLRDSVLKHKLGRFYTTDTTIGEGTIEFGSIMGLDKHNLIDFYSIEQDTSCPKKNIAQGYNHLKSLIAKN